MVMVMIFLMTHLYDSFNLQIIPFRQFLMVKSHHGRLLGPLWVRRTGAALLQRLTLKGHLKQQKWDETKDTGEIMGIVAVYNEDIIIY